jgi:phosphatidate phosphatase APP1
VLIQARALEAADIAPSSKHDTAVGNLLSTIKRVRSRALRGAKARVSIAGNDFDVAADDEGFFRAWIDHPSALPDAAWTDARIRLLAPLRANQPDVYATCRLRIPGAGARFGVISDLDDTVIQSRVGNLLEAARTVALGNSRTRLPFPGVAEFYHALERGRGTEQNPVFYVSSSPWNLYDLITEFLSLQGIPDGPVLLRDWDVGLSMLQGSRHSAYKEPLIREILETYPALPFILIGDTSQHDPEIYRAIVHAYPGRILAIYIRNVSSSAERSAAVLALAEEVAAHGSSLVLADDTAAASRHAMQRGWIG